MKRRNPSGPLLRALSLVLMLALTFACGTAGKAQLTAKADGLSVLQQEQETLRQEKALVQAELDLLVGQQMTALEQKVLLDRQMNLTIAEMELVNGQIAEYEALISEKEEEAALCREAERSQLSAYMTRIRAMEEAGDVTYYEILFDATDFSDLLGRLDVIREIMECDSAMYRELTAAREATEAAEAALEQGKAELVAKQEELAALQAEQTARIEEAGALIAAIESDINEYRKYEEEIAGLEDAVQAQIDAIVAEMEQIREETTGGNTGGSGGNAPAPDPDPETEPDPDPDPDPEPDPEQEPPADSGSYIWPTACTLVTSQFGNRLHPIWNEWRMHDGIDIGAGYGEAIWAARAGEVITAAEDEGYGNYVVLYHSDGTTTLYAHMSEIHCSWGDRVEQGQVIGLVGTTGWTDGPHLHFEIRVNGSCVDPLLYLP